MQGLAQSLLDSVTRPVSKSQSSLLDKGVDSTRIEVADALFPCAVPLFPSSLDEFDEEEELEEEEDEEDDDDDEEEDEEEESDDDDDDDDDGDEDDAAEEDGDEDEDVRSVSECAR